MNSFLAKSQCGYTDKTLGQLSWQIGIEKMEQGFAIYVGTEPVAFVELEKDDANYKVKGELDGEHFSGKVQLPCIKRDIKRMIPYCNDLEAITISAGINIIFQDQLA
ncbi:hypothetical protein N752_05715 [Desulforamulus aquiferis]|nr:hypothetical protein [Desulforamulus aquiferis]RYD06145.1 hypothetical protein N752_05715 [Desulforamulus aquiferis]